MKITEALLAEHVVYHTMFDHLERTVPALKSTAQIKALAGLLEAMLRAHSAVEDALLIEPLEHCIDQVGHRESFHGEHEEIESNLAAIQQVKQAAKARRLLLAAVLLAREHFDKEERLVFPLAEKVLNANTVKSLGQHWRERHKA